VRRNPCCGRGQQRARNNQKQNFITVYHGGKRLQNWANCNVVIETRAFVSSMQAMILMVVRLTPESVRPSWLYLVSLLVPEIRRLVKSRGDRVTKDDAVASRAGAAHNF
jgi:hypothetical protein